MVSSVRLFVSLLVFVVYSGCINTQRSSAPSTPSESASHSESAPAEPALDWHLHDADGPFRGVSATKAYATLLQGKAPKKRVVVAVMDSGVDVEHVDLRPNIWTNRDEVPGNGKDDDGNGYVDDIHGWNFVVDADGKTVATDTYEVTRELARLRSIHGLDGPDESDDDYAYYVDVLAAYESGKAQLEQTYAQMQAMYTALAGADSLLAKHLGVANPTPEHVRALETQDPALMDARTMWLDAAGHGMTVGDVREHVEGLQARVRDAYDLHGNNRAGVYEADSLYYGNHDLYGPDPFHGTHVAGIIGAVRGNDIGVDGIANHVEIMAIRTTPQGDERDRDVANGIRYAVDNGADIINMSFGKSHSGNKVLVDEAVRYAAEHDVLLVHGAGNDGSDLDVSSNFPRPFFADGTEAPNWIEVGATSWRTDETFAAFFSNYGKRTVDIFAPGRKIYSTQPENEYAAFDGTSLSSPIVAGVAALVMSYYPELSARQVREIILQSATSYADQQVHRPNMQKEEELTAFGTLSSTGGVVDAYNALKLAGETVQ